MRKISLLTWGGAALVAGALLLGNALTACSSADTTVATSANDSIAAVADSAKAMVKDFFVKGYEAHDYDFVMGCVAEDYVDHSPANARSNADAVGILKIVEGQFADMKITILDLFAEGNMVATRIRFEGTHVGACQGIEPTGRRISFEALENFRVANGKIVESWGYWPDDDIRRQLTAE